jgi:hypothetical protein
MVIACAADQVGSFAPASGWTRRLDATRGGAHANVELAAVDQLVTSEGDTGTITWMAAASPAGAKGAAATLAVRPSPSRSRQHRR